MKPRPLLMLLVLIWAISWPIIKVGVTAVPPIWFACLRYLIATGVLVLVAAARNELRFPDHTDRQLVLVSGLLQMAAYAAITSLALTRVPAGRASVLAFSTPLWVTPLAAWLGQERLTRRTVLGVGVGLLGIMTIALPSLATGGRDRALAYAMLIAAAGAWAISIVSVRGHRFTASPAALAPWQTLVATLCLLPIAVATEGPLPSISRRGLAALAYVGPIATAFAYWAVVDVGRRLKPTTLAVALLATPVLGLVISAITQGETISIPLLVGMALVAAGIRLTSTHDGQRHERVAGDGGGHAGGGGGVGGRTG